MVQMAYKYSCGLMRFFFISFFFFFFFFLIIIIIFRVSEIDQLGSEQ